MRCLILADPADPTALRVANLLRRRGGSVQVRTLEEIALAPFWLHAVTAGKGAADIRFHDGQALSDASPTVIFNRLTGVDIALFDGWRAEDRQYGQLELFALLVSWLASAPCPVVNRPSPSSLGGGPGRQVIWTALAAQAGLRPMARGSTTSTRRLPPPTGAVRLPDPIGPLSDAALNALGLNRPAVFAEPALDGASQALVVGDEVLGAPAGLAGACRRLAHSGKVELLRIAFARPASEPDAWGFAGADPWPVLDEAGELSVLAARLEALGTGPAAEVAA